MTPAARHQAAITVLDAMADGQAAEQALIRWARGARYAGSGDRAAVRDIVFDVLRCRGSVALMGGGESGRALVLGLLRLQGRDPESLFDGAPHAPAPLSPAERAGGQTGDPGAGTDLPAWLLPQLAASLGDDLPGYARALRQRAPVFLRVNAARTDRGSVRAALAAEGIETAPHPDPALDLALEVTGNPRRVQASAPYRDGRVELQDASSQAIVAALPLRPGMRVLDYCAGGGGKALAMAARLRGPVEVHDAAPRRMRDIPQRAQRAGATLTVRAHPRGPLDLVLCDVPCSGSGTWRRAPEGKWRLNPQALDALLETQSAILGTASGLVAPGGVLAYATCSVLDCENDARIAAFVAAHPGWSVEARLRLLPGPRGDGFFLSVLRRGG